MFRFACDGTVALEEKVFGLDQFYTSFCFISKSTPINWFMGIIREGDYIESLFDVKFSKVVIRVSAVVIIDPEGKIAGLLDFVGNNAFAEGV